MKRKKEIIVIILIIISTLILAFLPMLINNLKKEEENIIESKAPSTINIKITGELKVDELNIKIPYGYSYGYIINKIELYLNDYSIIDNNKTKRYYEDSVIIIESSDIKINDDDINNIDSNKININLASIDQLTSLYGIGEKRANAIIEYRKNKKIESFTELKELLGVSDEIINHIKEKAVLL